MNATRAKHDIPIYETRTSMNAATSTIEPHALPGLAFNAEAALARVDGDWELLRPMARMFAAQWRALSDDVAKSARRRDGAALELLAHRLKESLRSFGAADACRVAHELEARGRDGIFHDVETICADLKTELDRLVSGLNEFTKEMVPSTTSWPTPVFFFD